MKPFIDFDNLKKKDVEVISAAMREHGGQSPRQQALEPTLKEFMEFVCNTLRAVQERLQEKGDTEGLFDVVGSYEPKAERERFLKDIWNVQSNFWALIETLPTYYLTMMTILEKFELPEDKHLRLVSLGSGPGVYETFLGKLFGTKGIGGTITCVDFAPEMTAMQRFIMSLETPPLRNIEPITGDMANVPLPNRSVDALLVNNSLQWCTNWQKAIAEMARLLDPERKPWAYLIVHLHKQAMHVRTSTGERPVDMQPVLVPQIMDELEKHRFTIVSSRQLRSGHGGGQAGGTMDRVFLKTEFTPHGLRHRWREAQRTVTGGQLLRVNKK